MSQTPEIRIRNHYKALKARWDWQKSSMGALILQLAKTHHRSCQDIRQIVGRNAQASQERYDRIACEHNKGGSERKLHSCPFKVEINGNHERCACCEECTQSCYYDI